MSNSAHLSESVCLAVPVGEVAKILGISVRHVWALLAQGRLPQPVRLGRSVRWNLKELRDWLDAGAPDVVVWEKQRE
ncbi:MAG: helix-turn-helix domain-containing protein [Planctomycetes bacterium]|nr:helix-turn-helix domain-containing protein [Planctomycetota bacterium]